MKHITDADMKRFYSHTLSSQEEMQLLSHMAKCDFCAARMASFFPERELLSPPPDLSGDILETAKKLPTRRERQREFYRYSTKVVLAMGMALSLFVFFNLSGNIPSLTGSPNTEHYLPAQGNSEKKECNPVISPERQTYLEFLNRQEKKKKETREAQEKFLQEKEEQSKKREERAKNSGKISDSLNRFSSNILSYFKSEQTEK